MLVILKESTIYFQLLSLFLRGEQCQSRGCGSVAGRSSAVDSHVSKRDEFKIYEDSRMSDDKRNRYFFELSLICKYMNMFC